MRKIVNPVFASIEKYASFFSGSLALGVATLLFPNFSQDISNLELFSFEYVEELLRHIGVPVMSGLLLSKVLKDKHNKLRYSSGAFRYPIFEKYLENILEEEDSFSIIAGSPHLFNHTRLSEELVRSFAKKLQDRFGDVVFSDLGSKFFVILPESNERNLLTLIRNLEKELLCEENKFTFSYDLYNKEEDSSLTYHDLILRSSKILQMKKILDKGIPSSFRSLHNGLLMRDPSTYVHTLCVSKYSVEIGKIMGVSSRDLLAIKVASNLHDIGKIGIPDNILLKPGKLSNDEFEQMKRHSLEGFIEVVSSYPLLAEEFRPILEHHRRFDNSGYPDIEFLEAYSSLMLSPQMKNCISSYLIAQHKMSFNSRIVAIGDTIEAITAHRPYKNSSCLDFAKQELMRVAGTQLDPIIVGNLVLDPNWKRIERIYESIRDFACL